MPPGESLCTADFPGFRIYLGLIADGKTGEAMFDALPEQLRQFKRPFLFPDKFHGKQGHPVFPLLFGMLQGIVGKFQQIQVIVRIGRINRTAGGYSAIVLFAVIFLLPAEFILYAAKDLLRLPLFPVQYQDAEFIAVQTVNRCIGGKHLGNFLCRRPEHPVPESSVIQIIHIFEGIHIQDHNIHPVPFFMVRQILLDISLKGKPVKKPRHMIRPVYFSQIRNQAGKQIRPSLGILQHPSSAAQPDPFPPGIPGPVFDIVGIYSSIRNVLIAF